METGEQIIVTNKREFYNLLGEQLQSLIGEEPDLIANLANAASLLFWQLEEVNWVGFYLLRGDELVLGPFQGKPACVRIAVGKGVCGVAMERCETVVVPDVHQFPGHIACDQASRSEIVIPLLSESKRIGVLDIDSPSLSRFDNDDRTGLELYATTLMNSVRG